MEKTEKLKAFRGKIEQIYGSVSAEKIFKEIDYKPLISFRVNNLKANVSTLLEELSNQGFVIKNAAFPNAFYVELAPEGLSLSSTSAFNEGKIYIQNLSSMIPSLVLDPKPGEKILDLCSAPGSKTSHIAALSENKSEITAVENNVKRLNALKINLELQGVTNVSFIRASAQALPFSNPGLLNYFDKVLCDVPCSNEGLIREPGSYDFSYWNPKNAKQLSQLQKKIVSAGIKMLKPGGTLVYSTCTYSVEENEGVVDWALKKFKNVKIEAISPDGVSFQSGITNWKGKKFYKSIQKAERILPDRNYEAFFIVKLVKLG